MAEEVTPELEALAAVAELVSLQFVEISAVRADLAAEEAVAPQFALRLGEPEVVPDSGGVVRFHVGLRVMIVAEPGRANVEAFGTFDVPAGTVNVPTSATITAYANEVAVMVLLPYLRQGLADISQRVFGSVILMPVFSRGQLHFPDPES